MSYYMIQSSVGDNVDIVHSKEYKEGTIIYSGSFDTVTDLVRRLRYPPVINLIQEKCLPSLVINKSQDNNLSGEECDGKNDGVHASSPLKAPTEDGQEIVPTGTFSIGFPINLNDTETTKSHVEQTSLTTNIEDVFESRSVITPQQMDNADIESSPLFTISQVKIVTDSGNTKSVNSKYHMTSDEEDPYKNPEFSSDEYVPKSSASDSSSSRSDVSDKGSFLRLSKSVKKRLFSDNLSEKSQSSSYSTVGESRSINGGVGPESQLSPSAVSIQTNSSEGTSKSSSRADSREKLTLGVVTVQKGRIRIDFLAPGHSGTYNVKLFSRCLPDGTSFLQGYLMVQSLPHHLCNTLVSTEAASICDTDRVNNNMVCHLERCCPKGIVLTGFEKFLKKTQSNIGILFLEDKTSKKRTGRKPEDFIKDQDYDDDQHLNEDLSEDHSTKLKKHFCIFCRRLKTCIGRHIQKVHEKEEAVQKLLEMKSSLQRQKELRRLRLEGDKIYNLNVPRQKRIAVRKPLKHDIKDNVHCPNCSGLIGRKYFAKHHRTCTKRPPDYLKRINEVEFNDCRRPLDGLDKIILDKLMKDLRDDDITAVIKEDKLIQELGIHSSKTNKQIHQLRNARQLMRTCSRLLIILRQLDPTIVSMEDAIDPTKYRTLMDAVRQLSVQAGDPTRITTLKHPTIALKSGPMISSLVTCLRRTYCEQGSGSAELEEKLQKLSVFRELHKDFFSHEITHNALESMVTNKFNKRREIPSPRDIEKLRDYCNRQFTLCYNYLQTSFNQEKWKRLGEVILVQLMVFNRRRPGEMSRTLLSDYVNKKSIGPEEYSYLNRLERICADHFTIIHIRGKRGRQLGILLSPENIRGLDLFIKWRQEAGVPSDNPYLFCSHHRTGYMSANLVLKSFTLQCGAEKPETLTGTDLRKQVATMCQLFNLNDNQLKQVADFMGHSLRIHDSHYRLPEHITQIVNVSRFLGVVGDKDLFKHKGKSWDELEALGTEVSLDDLQDDEDDDNDDEEGDTTSVPLSSHTNQSQFECDYDLPPPDEKTPTFESVQLVTEDTRPIAVDAPQATEVTPSTAGNDEQMITDPQTTTNGSHKSDAPENNKRVYKRRRITPRRFKNVTPQKQKATVRSPSSPSTHNLLNILSDPSNRRKIAPFTGRMKAPRERWNTEEIAIMMKYFGDYATGKICSGPSQDLVAKVFREHKSVFHQSRNISSLSQWVRNQRKNQL